MTSDPIPTTSPVAKTSDFSFLVAGVVRNGEQYLSPDVMRLRQALSGFGKLQWLLVESDSTDSTLAVLEGLKRDVPDFRYVSLGNLRNRLSQRTARIAHCRNAYVERIRNHAAYKDLDFIVVADFDGLNSHITDAAFATCFERNDWDACTANQRGPYYDIWALRHPTWCANDCWAQFRFMRQFVADSRVAKFVSIYSKMMVIPPESDWIAVDSAFGGLAVYKRELFDSGLYEGLAGNGTQVCEHVAFHAAMRKRGYRIFINPGLINAEYTEYTEPLRNGQAWQPNAYTASQIWNLTVSLLNRHPHLAGEFARLAAMIQEKHKAGRDAGEAGTDPKEN
ncbi:MAG: hypothetical protein HXY27_00865 [Hydrogenophilaceae bacterium]|nr:hypothetical protein [Hydrogenophilaceae bacterium]